MPGLSHEALRALFENRPSLAPELLRSALDVPVPSWTEARLQSADLTDIVPTEYRADLVVLLVEEKPVLAIIVEVQASVVAGLHREPVGEAGRSHVPARRDHGA
jgi:hypothetical protein